MSNDNYGNLDTGHFFIVVHSQEEFDALTEEEKDRAIYTPPYRETESGKKHIEHLRKKGRSEKYIYYATGGKRGGKYLPLSK